MTIIIAVAAVAVRVHIIRRAENNTRRVFIFKDIHFYTNLRQPPHNLPKSSHVPEINVVILR